MGRKKGNLVTAIVLILVGVWFLLVEISPAVRAFAYGAQTWPLPIVGIGALLGVLGLITWTPGLLIPAAIVGGIGGLLYYQNTTQDWESWAYAWALIPGFVGLGLMFFGLLSRRGTPARVGVWMLLVSLVVFAIFATAFGGMAIAGKLWPALLILIGLLFLFRSFARPRRT